MEVNYWRRELLWISVEGYRNVFKGLNQNDSACQGLLRLSARKRTDFFYNQSVFSQAAAMEHFYCLFTIFGSLHLNIAETLRLPGVMISNNVDRVYRTVNGKELFQLSFGGAVIKVTNIYFQSVLQNLGNLQKTSTMANGVGKTTLAGKREGVCFCFNKFKLRLL